MKNKLSFSKINLYNECGLKYKLRYIDRLHPVIANSSLLFGSAIDKGFNALLRGQPFANAQTAFIDAWTHTTYNNKPLDIKNSPELIKYSQKDLDKDLLSYYNQSNSQTPEWTSLYYKGLLMLDCYKTNILPLFKKVLAVQEPIKMQNKDGDTIKGDLDFRVQMHDDKIYIMDNKTSSVKYEKDAAKKSDQLVIYKYAKQPEEHIDGVGFIVLNKIINLNKVKTCLKCGTINKTSHKTCDNILNGKRCYGVFDIKMDPKVGWKLILNEVEKEDEKRTIENFDLANEGISNEIFEPNSNACIGKFGKCQYFDLCYEGSRENLIKLEKKK